MKYGKIVRTIFMAVILAAFILTGKASAAGGVDVSSANFPDAVFRNYVKEHFDTDNSNFLSSAEIAAATEIDVREMGIGSLKGVEFFTSLQNLYCYRNELTALDVSACRELEILRCYDNAMTTLNVSGCTALYFLDCGGNMLTSLDVSGCNALEQLFCFDNQLTVLNIQGCQELQTLSCPRNLLRTLNVSGFSELRGLYCGDNMLSTLNVSGCGNLEVLFCENNLLTSLTLGVCTHLYDLTCYGNQLSELNIAGCPNMVYVYQNGTRSENDEYQSWFIMLDKVTDYYLRCDKNIVIKAENEPVITAQPRSASAYVGGTAKFTVAATGTGLTYRWQYRYPGESWKNSGYASGRTPTLQFSALAKYNNLQYRCKITDANGNTVMSSVVKLTILPKITAQPKSISAAVGETARFTVTATGAGLKYQWQYKYPDGSWTNSGYASGKTAALSFAALAKYNNLKYRCRITDANGKTVTSSAVTLTIAPKITSQPKSRTVSAGNTVKFTVTATGAGLKYQWQYKYPDGTWTNSGYASGKTATLQFTALAKYNGIKYRCIITDANGKKLTSSTATLTVN